MAKADAVSYREFRKESPLSATRTTAPVKHKISMITVMDMASRTCRSEIDRLNTRTWLWPLALATEASNSTATVTVLRPPAVEPLEPPISISTMDTARVDSLIAPWSMAANPAVRVVTDWKAPASSFWGTVIGPRVAGLFHSMAQINPAPIKIKRPEQVKTSLEYTDRRRRLRVRTARSRSSQTKKPRPPTTMSAIMVRQTTGSF